MPLGGSGPLPSILPYDSNLPPLIALWGRGSGSLPGSAKLFQVDPGSRPAAPGVSGGARSDDPNRMSRPTPERALPSRVGGAAKAASAPPAYGVSGAPIRYTPTAPWGGGGVGPIGFWIMCLI